MAFGISTKGIRTLTNYEEASNWEAQVIPVRGDANNTKPLGPRDKKHMNIRRDGEDVVIQLYHTDVITYKPDGSIIINTGGYNSQSTVSILQAVLPWGVRPHLFNERVWMWGDYNEEGCATHTGHYRVNQQATIELNPFTQNYRIHNPDPVYTHSVNRTAKREVTKEYAPFLAYVKAITALRAEDGEVVLGDGERVPHLRPQDLDDRMRGDDPADHYDAFLSVASWRRYYRWGTDTSRTACSVSSIKRAIDKHIIKHNAERVLTKTQAPWGQPVADKYKRYV